MRKKLLKFGAITLVLIMSGFMNVSLALAQQNPLFQPVTAPSGAPSKITLVNQLPHGSWESILANAIKLILAVTGSLAFIAFTVGGVMFLTAQGQEDKLGKAKGTLYWSIVALVIIAASYAIVLGITQLKFFQ